MSKRAKKSPAGALERFINEANALEGLDVVYESALKAREQCQKNLGKALPVALPAILEKLGYNSSTLATKLSRTQQALSNYLLEKNASVPVLLGIYSLLQGKKPKMPSVAKRKAKPNVKPKAKAKK